MNLAFKDLLNFYINSSIHVSLAIVSLAAVTFLNFQIPTNFNLLGFIFFASITSYNFIKYAGIAKLHHRSLAKNLKVIQIFSFLAFLGLIYFTLKQPLPILLIAVVTGVFTLLYAIPIFSENRNLRTIPGVKIYVIALVVAGVTVLMPMVYGEGIYSGDILLEFLQRTFLAIALVLPFEIRDLKFDMAQLGTLPQVLGVGGTRRLGYVLLALVILMELVKSELRMSYFLSLIGVGIITGIFIRGSAIRQKEYYASFWVEAIPIFWLILLVILNSI